MGFKKNDFQDRKPGEMGIGETALSMPDAGDATIPAKPRETCDGWGSSSFDSKLFKSGGSDLANVGEDVASSGPAWPSNSAK